MSGGSFESTLSARRTPRPRRGHDAPRASRALLGAALLAASSGCARQAPGPSECQELALIVVGVADRRVLAHPAVKAEVDSWTARCLTTPYDRELLACVRRGERGCYQAFAERHPERAERDARRIRE